jgi:UDP-N-acetylglucosamine--N-acetylmuramyl-(pentapeptide) pyrophosphoryl-undecaprenol N-acetylglucosamine transferase
MGIPTALLNPDTAPGRANRFLGRRVKVVLAQWEESRKHFDAQVDVRVVGCPVRRSIREADRDVGRGRFGLSDDRKTLLVTGASQGARSINLAMISLAEDLARCNGWQVLHLTGEADLAAVRASYSRAGVKAVCLSYTEQMGDALAASDLVVSRAGASTLAEITALGRPSILVPYPHHRDGHQLSNARVLVSRGAARISYDTSDAQRSARNLHAVLIGLMNDGDELKRLAAGAARLGVKDAAERVAQVLLELAAASG